MKRERKRKSVCFSFSNSFVVWFQGAFGFVYEGLYQRTRAVAVKEFGGEAEEGFLDEAKTMSVLQEHPNVVALIGVVEGEQERKRKRQNDEEIKKQKLNHIFHSIIGPPILIVTELMAGGDLRTYIKKHPVIDMGQKLRWIGN